jgi:predicted nucleotidyltransferase
MPCSAVFPDQQPRPVMKNLIDLRHDYLAIVESVLKQYLQDYTVWAFGSRVAGTARKFSDLDLAVISDAPLDFGLIGMVRDAFSESDLPFKVDVVDWADLSREFREIIKRNYVVIQGH